MHPIQTIDVVLEYVPESYICLIARYYSSIEISIRSLIPV